MRLIDADALMLHAEQYRCGRGEYSRMVDVWHIENAPTFDPESLRPQGTWISANNPPQKRGEYIVAIKYAEVSTTLVFDGTSWIDYSAAGQKIYYDVTHWMPLPDPPKVE